MEDLNRSLKKLEQLNQVEQQKKRKYLKIKQKNKVVEEDNHGYIKMFLRKQEQFKYKNKMRLKSLRNVEQKEVAEDFDEKYNEKQNTIFNKEWRKLNNQLKLNRLYRYLKIRQNELEWTQEQYEENKEMSRDKLNVDGLRKDIEYDVETGEIKNCWLFDEKKEETSDDK